MKKTMWFLVLLLLAATSFAQEAQSSSASVEMASELRSSGKIYVVVASILLIFIGLAVYLYRLDRRVSKIEKETK